MSALITIDWHCNQLRLHNKNTRFIVQSQLTLFNHSNQGLVNYERLNYLLSSVFLIAWGMPRHSNVAVPARSIVSYNVFIIIFTLTDLLE